MEKLARAVLVVYVFTIPWEYSLDLGAPLGNIARICGLFLLLAVAASLVARGSFRRPGPLQWLVLTLFVWSCCTYFWSIGPDVTVVKLRGYFQEIMIVWLAWELVETPAELRRICRAWVAGSLVLALLTIADFVVADTIGSEQIRFAAFGQDPNDVARFLDLAFPLAALLLDGRESLIGKVLCLVYFPAGILGTLLTASRSGFVTAAVALTGCAVIAGSRGRRIAGAGAFVTSLVAGMAWLIVPREAVTRLGTVVQQIRGGDLNQRMNIWSAGWQAFAQAPLFGHGAGSFVIASRLAAIDTAHNTVLSILVEGGITALFLSSAIVVVTIRSIRYLSGSLQIALATLLGVWLVSSLVGTVGESRVTWLMFGMTAVAERIVSERGSELDREFPTRTLGPVCLSDGHFE